MESSVELPVLDISQPLDQQSLFSLSRACEQWGFFRIKNHGISPVLYEKIYSVSRNVFSFPLENKLELQPLSCIESYTPHFIASPFFESLRVSGPNFFESAKSYGDVLFDHRSSEFSEILREYGAKMTELSQKIIQILLLSLGNDFVEKYLKKEFKNCHGYLRIINYSPPENITEEIEGLGMHTDMSCITIVYQDDIGGLQVKSRQGIWMDINPCEGTLVVNIGDLLQAWSNELFRSSEHRVVLRRQVKRLSLAFFWCFENDKVVLAPDEVAGENNLKLYEPFVCSDYLKFRESNERGRFDKVGFNVKGFAGIQDRN